jgi:predicted transcriptional regulator
MQIHISNIDEARKMALSAGFDSVEDYVNRLIKKEVDLQAVCEGIDDAKAGRLRTLDEFDAEFRSQRGIALDAV